LIRGVLLDLDGLMTDTERLFLESWAAVMEEQGYPAHREIVIHCIGMDLQSIETYVHQALGSDFDYEGILRAAEQRSKSYIAAHGVPVKQGLQALLDGLDQRGIPYGVATSSVSFHARERLRLIGVLDRLSGLVTGDMVFRGKPDPEIYRRAAASLGLPPEDCLALEDSPCGVRSAFSAGCKPVMIPDLQQPDPEIRKMLVGCFYSLDQVLSNLDSL